MFGYLLSPGSTSSKRGILSIVHRRVSEFLTCVEGLYTKSTYKSYHGYENLIIQPFFNYQNMPTLTEAQAVFFVKILIDYYKIKLNVDPNIDPNQFN
jgi:hypothetical protein